MSTNPFQQWLETLIRDTSRAGATARLTDDLPAHGLADGDVILETEELPAGVYSVSIGIRAATNDGWVGCKLNVKDVAGQDVRVFTNNEVSTNMGPMAAGTFRVQLEEPGTFQLLLDGSKNFTTQTDPKYRFTARECHLTAERRSA